MSIQKLISAVVLGATIAVAGHGAIAQPSLPPLPFSAPPAPSGNIEAEIAKLTQRYALSSDQAAKVRTILEEQVRKFQEVAHQDLPPQDGLGRLQSVKDEEISRVSAVLTPEQRMKYEQDARSAFSAARPSGSR